MIGLILGNRYELIEKIGEGGMSEVYKAKCNKLNRFVAVKILKKEFCDNEEIVNKFKKEATAIATLSDNNIVNVLDVGTQDEINYIVMEYVKGMTLKEAIVKFGKMNYETCITIGIQIAKALDCAHRNNVIHRDVKPQNILVTEDGVIKVTDFGIAKSTSSATLTNTTTIMGSAHYFSPEQAKGTFIDNRTDIYSLGIVLYEMATGKLPFEGESPVTIALKHIQEEVLPPKMLNSKIPESLNSVILKAMEKETSKRYQNAKEVIADLQRIKENPDVVIGLKEDSTMDDGHTIVMPPVGGANKKENIKEDLAKKDLEDDYYDDYEDEYDDYEKKKSSKKSNKTLIGSIVAVVLLIAIAVGSYFIFSNKFSGPAKPEQVTIPTIIGLDKEDAKAKLKELGLEYTEITESTEKDDAGKVLGVSPSEGSKVDKGSKVRVTVSTGKSTMKFHDYTKQDIDRVKQFITTEFGIPSSLITIVPEFSDDVSEGKVIRQMPEANSPVTKDTNVILYVSKGKETKTVKVPDVNGFTLDAAKRTLEGLKLTVKVSEKEVKDKKDDGIVLDVTNVGKMVEEGATVTITVGKYKEQQVIDTSILKKNAYKNDVIETLVTNGVNRNDIIIQGSGDYLKEWSFSAPLKKGDKITLIFSPDEV